MAEAEHLDLRTVELRPHDDVIEPPPGNLPAGREVRLVTDSDGHPFPAEARGVLRVYCGAGDEGMYGPNDRWTVKRHPLDGCRSCFLYEAARAFDRRSEE